MSAWWTARGRDEQLRVNRVERLVVEQWELLRTLRLRALLADPDCFGSTLEAEQGRPEGFWRESCGTRFGSLRWTAVNRGGLLPASPCPAVMENASWMPCGWSPRREVAVWARRWCERFSTGRAP